MSEIEKKVRHIRDLVLIADRSKLEEIRVLVVEEIEKYPILLEHLQKVIDIIDKLLKDPI